MLKGFISVAVNSGPNLSDMIAQMKFAHYVNFSGLVRKVGIESAAKQAISLGYLSVEFLDIAGRDGFISTFKSPDEAVAAKAVLDRYGLSVACYSVGVTLISEKKPTVADRKAVEELKRLAEIAAVIGSPFLHHTLIMPLSLPTDAPSYEEVLPSVLDAAEEVANYCKGIGLICLYEPQGMYFNGVEGYGRFYREIRKRCPNVGVCADIGNTIFIDQSPLPFVEMFARDTMHVHLKNYRLRPPRPDGETSKLRSKSGICLECVSLKSGDIDIVSCLQILKKAGYNGAFALEDHYDPDETADAMRFVAKIYE